jgi:ribose transport system substrate-binding protein
MKKVLLCVLITLLCVMGVWAGGQKEAPKSEASASKGILAVAMPAKGHPVHQIVQLGFLTRAKELGYEGVVIGIDGDSAPEFYSNVEGFANRDNVKGMLLWVGDPQGYPTVKRVHAKGIKTVIPHFPHNQKDIPELDANLSAQPYDYGLECAKVIGEALKGKTGSVAITQGSFNNTENAAAQGFTDGMKNYPNLKVLAPQLEGFDTAKASAANAAIINGNKDLLAAFGTTGGSPNSWATAAEQTKRPDILIIGMDYTEQNIDLVEKGKVYAIVAQPLYDEAYKSADILDKLIRGETVPYYTKLEAPVVTKEGIGAYKDIILRVKEWFKK